MLAPYGVSQFNINTSAKLAADSLIGLKYITSGKPFIILADLNDTARTAKYCIVTRFRGDGSAG